MIKLVRYFFLSAVLLWGGMVEARCEVCESKWDSIEMMQHEITWSLDQIDCYQSSIDWLRKQLDEQLDKNQGLTYVELREFMAASKLLAELADYQRGEQAQITWNQWRITEVNREMAKCQVCYPPDSSGH